MSGVTPEQAIRGYLAPPETAIATVRQPGGSGWSGRTSSGRLDARLESFVFGKRRALGARLVYAVTFTTRAGAPMRFICHLRRDQEGDWRFEGGAGGGVGGDPRRGQSWVNFCGSYGRDFYAGGWSLEDGGALARVRLAGASGYLLEDTPDADGVVLFLADDPPLPLQVELLDGAGQVIARDRPLG